MIQTPWSVSLIMDKNLIFLMIAAFICGSYKNEANRPEPFQGRFAKAIEYHRIPKIIQKPHYLSHYGVISASTGNIYKMYYILPLIQKKSIMQLLIVYIFILFQRKMKLRIYLYASLLMQQIVWTLWQHHRALQLVKTCKVGGYTFILLYDLTVF